MRELPCVWVSAGVLSYRPCDRAYECEGCPLYQALRGRADREGAEPNDEPVARYLAELGAGCRLNLDRAYSAEGLWLADGAEGRLLVGLDDYTLRLLQPVDGVVLPRPGVVLKHGAPCAWMSRGRLAIPLHCPMAGEVTLVNPNPVPIAPQGPDGADQRWWFSLVPHEPVAEAPGLLRNEALLSWFEARVGAVHRHLSAVMAPPAGAAQSPSLCDGGIPTLNLEMVLGRERFEALVGTLFPLQS